MYPETYQNTIQDIKNFNIILPDGSQESIAKLANISMKKGVAQINRENLKSMGVITARLDNRDLGSTLKDIKSQLAEKVSLPASYHIEYGGSYKEQQQAFSELLLILISALLLVFLVILFLFKRIKIALAIVIIAILGVAGSLLSLFITGTPLKCWKLYGNYYDSWNNRRKFNFYL